MKKVRESALQKKVIRYAHSRGILWRLLSWRGRRGAPDLFLARSGRVLLLELKRPSGGRLSALQKREGQALRDAGLSCLVAWNWEDAKRTVDGWALGFL